MMKTYARVTKLRALNVAALAVALYVANYLLAPFAFGTARLQVLSRPNCDQKFDETTWKDAAFSSSTGHRRRYEMVDDLLKDHLVVGMTEDRVKAMLGSPDGGILDRATVLALKNPYGIQERQPLKSILASPENIAIWTYLLASQSEFPASSVWFPWRFANCGRWKLHVVITDGKVSGVSIAF